MSNAIKATALACLLPLLATNAHAVITERLKQACRAEYYAHCSAHTVGSASLRHCMRAMQDRLSQVCLRELVAAGEVSKGDIRRFKVRKQR